VVNQIEMLALDNVESADAATDVDANALFVFGRDLQSGGGQRVFTRRNGEMNKPAHLLDFFFLDKLRGVEVFNLTGDLAGQNRSIELLDARNARFSFQN
jgi:hypothetical protein